MTWLVNLLEPKKDFHDQRRTDKLADHDELCHNGRLPAQFGEDCPSATKNCASQPSNMRLEILESWRFSYSNKISFIYIEMSLLEKYSFIHSRSFGFLDNTSPIMTFNSSSLIFEISFANF